MIYLVAWTGGIEYDIPSFEFFVDEDEARERFEELLDQHDAMDGSYLHLIGFDHKGTQEAEVLDEA